MMELWNFARICTMTFVCVLLLGIGIEVEAAVPGAVTGLKQVDAGPNSVEIRWDAVIGNHMMYKVELCANQSFMGGVMDNLEYNSKEQIVGAAINPDQSFRGLSPGKKYYVRVTAFSNSGSPDYKCTWGPKSKVLEVVTAPANSNIENFTQTKASETSITLSWKKYSEANAYQLVYAKKGSGKRTTLKLGDVKSCTVKKLSKNGEYQFWLWPVKKSADGFRALNGKGKTLYWCSVLPTKVKGVKCEFGDPSSNFLDISWNLHKLAKGYQYQVYTEGGKKALLTGKKAGKVKKTDVTSDKLKGLRFLRLRMRGYVKIDGSAKYGAWSDWTYFSRQPKLTLESAKDGMKLSWGKVEGATDYTVYLSDKRASGYKKAGNTKKTSYTVKKWGKSNLETGKMYYFIVTANKKVGKKTFHSPKSYCFWRTYGK